RRQLDRALAIRRDQDILGATEPTASRVFLGALLRKAREEAVFRVLELLEVAGDGPMIRNLRGRLFSRDDRRRRLALELLAEACPGSDDMLPDLAALLSGDPVDPGSIDPGLELEVLARMAAESSPFLRAGAVWAAATHSDDSAAALVAHGLDDEHPLVRETAEEADRGRRGGPLTTVETMHFLYAVPLFANLEPEDLYEVATLAFEETVSPPDAIVEAGDVNSDALFVILEGRARVLPVGWDVDPADAPIVTAGRVVGELSVLDGNPRNATVEPVDGPVRVLRVPGPPFRSGVLRRQHIAQTLFGALTAQIRDLSAQLSRRGS
ncbi:MAG: cyclic nucleotide-binding domain-containing protein, partial [Thermoanaerobaculia bacterium]|nr:cyclic nucleotide-binding domain-containing protein [Thermoanaerobaculia bacterium]